MAGYVLPMKMKRKGVDQVGDDFSDFSLSSPARKIRRLDAELPPIVEEEEPVPEVPLVYDYEQPMPEAAETLMEESPSAPLNDERAIVLFKPVNSPPFVSPSNFSLTVDSNIFSGIKNQRAWSGQSDEIRSAKEEPTSSDKDCDRLAVVPWVPSQFPPVPGADLSNTEACELMEAEETDEASMDVEEDIGSSTIDPGYPTLHGGITGADGLHQWQQQHCLIPQLPQNTSTPITWTR